MEDAIVYCKNCKHVDMLWTDDYGYVLICTCKYDCDGYDTDEGKSLIKRPFYEEI